MTAQVSAEERLTPAKAKKRMRAAVASLQEYMRTYDQQAQYETYSDSIFIQDVIYGLGIALDAEKYSHADGFCEFKKFLRDFLEKLQ